SANPELTRVSISLPEKLHKREKLFSLVEGTTIQETMTELIETGLNAWDAHHQRSHQKGTA
ncbi:MAG: hypothetical protein FWG97_05635, partial [Deltaproteobacteria bacterium]|nr:hypothetical protein [Deltaproteobacteria bacterium]